MYLTLNSQECQKEKILFKKNRKFYCEIFKTNGAVQKYCQIKLKKNLTLFSEGDT